MPSRQRSERGGLCTLLCLSIRSLVPLSGAHVFDPAFFARWGMFACRERQIHSHVVGGGRPELAVCLFWVACRCNLPRRYLHPGKFLHDRCRLAPLPCGCMPPFRLSRAVDVSVVRQNHKLEQLVSEMKGAPQSAAQVGDSTLWHPSDGTSARVCDQLSAPRTSLRESMLDQ